MFCDDSLSCEKPFQRVKEFAFRLRRRIKLDYDYFVAIKLISKMMLLFFVRNKFLLTQNSGLNKMRNE